MSSDRDRYLHVPARFDEYDDGDDQGEVHSIARILFTGRTNAEVFGKARSWLSTYDVHVVDLAWNYLLGEPNPMMLSVYFGIDEEEPEEESTKTRPAG